LDLLSCVPGWRNGIRDGLKSAPQILVIAVAREVWQQFKWLLKLTDLAPIERKG